MVPGITFSCFSRNMLNDLCGRNEAEKFINEIEILESPERPLKDKKEYRVIKLPNGLTALLISDLATLTECDSLKPNANSDLEEAGTTNINVNVTEESEEREEPSKCDVLTNDDGENSEPAKNEEDTKKERELSNSNEIDEKELLKNNEMDETELKSQYSPAAALHIGVGSFVDPPEIQGLMHFLEHMVLMGSEKYPMENYFKDFITKYEGHNSSLTCSETTTFFFDVEEPHFKEGLNIFANLFISPLMKVEAMQKERQTIQEEFQKADNDLNRIKQLIGSIIKEDHPISFLEYGNEKTLKLFSDQELHSKLHEVRSKYYSAQFMTLAVQARETLDKLQELVASIFSEIPNNRLPRPSYENYDFPFTKEKFHRFYKVIPLNDVQVLELTWAFEPLCRKYYESKPTWYISNLIGDEGFGSIISFLKKKDWAFTLTSGRSIICNSVCELFGVAISLTNEGLLHIKEIILMVFQYISIMKNEGPKERIFTDDKKIRQIKFDFPEESSPASTVILSAIAMEIYPPKHIYSGDVLTYTYNPLVIDRCLSSFGVNNCNIILLSKLLEKENLTLQEEKWFGTKYCVEDIPQDWIEEWENAKPIPELFLPLPNDLIPDDFEIFNWSDSSQDPPEYPQVIESSKKLKRGILWFKPDFKYLLPKVYCKVFFRVLDFGKSVEIESMLDIFFDLFNHHILEALYPSRLAQYEVSLGTCDLGFVLNLVGFNQKLYKFLEQVLSQIEEFEKILDDKTFNEIKTQRLNCFYNQLLDPEIIINDTRNFILHGIYWPIVEKMIALEKLEKDCISAFLREIYPNKFSNMLVQGNITEDEAKKLFNLIIDTSSVPDDEIKYRKMPVRRIKQGEHVIRFKSLDTASSNSAILNYYQGEWTSMRNNLLNEFISFVLGGPCFDAHVAQDHVKYSVKSSNLDTYGAIGLEFKVLYQADKFSLTVANGKIESFLETISENLKNMKEEEVTNLKEMMKDRRLIDDATLEKEIERNFIELTDYDCMFDRRQQELPLISTITVEEVYEYFQKLVFPVNNENYRKLSIQVMGYSSPDEDTQPSYESSLGKSAEEILELIPPTEEDLKSGLSNDQFVLQLRSFIEELTIFENPVKID